MSQVLHVGVVQFTVDLCVSVWGVFVAGLYPTVAEGTGLASAWCPSGVGTAAFTPPVNIVPGIAADRWNGFRLWLRLWFWLRLRFRFRFWLWCVAGSLDARSAVEVVADLVVSAAGGTS